MKLEQGYEDLQNPTPLRRRGRPKKNLAAQLASPLFSILEESEHPIPRRSHSEEQTKVTKEDKYEFGKIISSGMIGVVYLGRNLSRPFFPHVCIKKMYGEKMGEKNIFPSLRREIEILHKISKIEGCVKFVDVLTDEKSLSIVFPYYHQGDLYKFSSPN